MTDFPIFLLRPGAFCAKLMAHGYAMMLFNQTTFIGIDPTAGLKPFAYAALDNDLRPVALGECRMDEVLAFAAGQRQAVVGVCAPRRPNQGVMRRADVRQNLTPMPAPGRWIDFRLADYLLRQRNLSAPQTPAQVEACPNWMKTGFTLYRRLESMGYKPYFSDQADLQMLEIYPYASYAALLGVIPFPKYTLEGRLQRQLALYEQKVHVPDAMQFFEEITRRRLLRGVLPADILYSSGELDALVAAFTAWQATLHPDQVSMVGDPQEGQIVLPVAELKSRY
jgi:hypothetical protein